MEQYPQTQFVPPNHIESEKSVLGSMLRSKEAALLAIENLEAEDFYDPANREVYSAMCTLSSQSRPIDFVTLDEELTRRGKLDAIGGAPYLIELGEKVPSAVNIQAYIQIVDEKSTLRKLIHASEEITRACYDTEQEVSEVLEMAEKSIYNITMRKGGEELQHIQPILLRTFEKIEELVLNKGNTNGVPTGYADLDKLLTGLHGGELILVAGRPAMGKTSIGMNFIENAAIRCDKKTAVFSLEMTAEQIAQRMLCTEAKVNMQNVRNGDISDEDWIKISNALMTIGEKGIYIDCTPGISVPEVRSKARRLQLEHGLDVIMIDYLSLMSER